MDKFVIYCRSLGHQDEQLASLQEHVDHLHGDNMYRGQVWPMQAFVGAIARFRNEEQNVHRDPEVVSCWVAATWRVRAWEARGLRR